ncbi:MAG: 4-hydroxythreonine-4-phosphate dehydrogenase PdxA [candidate division WOR-3 bacterium]|nr:MAG: 4-hydroxythreonine-4-phosphate dehydrogenase PdxA [candidate division WOR-3 bacterium]
MRIGITLGDPAGIGPEIILKALPKIKDRQNILVFGNRSVLKKTARDFRLIVHYKKIEKNIVDCVDYVKFQYGKPTDKTARIAMQSIDTALQHGCDILVTAPVVKSVIKCAIPDFIGHTEYLAHFFRVKDFGMLGLWKDKRILLLTTHVPLRHIFKMITPKAITKKIVLLDWGLKKYFGIRAPSIGVCSLNPHAFEFSLGEDERIKEGIDLARTRGLNALGPFPADTLFSHIFDGYLTIYHDQAMIYLKSKKNGLNFTLGLPIVRLSPLYGAALDIAGKNVAEVSGFITAIKEGIKIFKQARNYEAKTT